MPRPTITDPEIIHQLELQLEKIYRALDAETLSKIDDYSLLSGKAGIALFFLYYAKHKKDENAANNGFALINECIDYLQQGNVIPTYADGIAGIGWTLEHLVRENFIELDDDKSLADLDDIMLELMEESLQVGVYDFLHGGLGYANYLYLRSKRVSITSFPEIFYQLLKECANADTEESINWVSTLLPDEDIMGVNLGIAHGIPAIIALLSKLYQQKNDPLAEELVRKTINFLIQFKQEPGIYRSCYPSWVIEGKPTASRLAWCYGDLGIALALDHAQNAFDDKELTNELAAILSNSANRKDLEADFVVDAGLCHGAAGILHIMNNFYKRYPDYLSKQLVEFWARKTLEMARFSDGLAGYKSLRSHDDNRWVSEAGLLEGIAGIGLTIMSLLSDIEPWWDECLLIS